MVDFSGVRGVASQILNRVVTGGIMVIGVVIFAILVLVILLYVRYIRQFNIDVEIKSTRSRGATGGGESVNYKLLSDKGGMIHNKKDKRWYFRLRKERVDLPLPPYQCFQIGEGGRNKIKIWQPSHEVYHYMLPDKINTSKMIIDGEEINIAEQEMKVVSGGDIYWNILKKKDMRKIFDPESLLMKLLPYIIPVLMFMLVIFMTYFITQHWGEFTAAAKALEEAAKILQETTQAQAQIVAAT